MLKCAVPKSNRALVLFTNNLLIESREFRLHGYQKLVQRKILLNSYFRFYQYASFPLTKFSAYPTQHHYQYFASY